MSQYADAFLHWAEARLKASTALKTLGVAIYRDAFPTGSCDWPRVLLTEVSSQDILGGCGHPVSGQVLLQAMLQLDRGETGADARQKRILDAIGAALIGVHSHDFFGESFTVTVRSAGRTPGFTGSLSGKQIRRVMPLFRGFLQS